MINFPPMPTKDVTPMRGKQPGPRTTNLARWLTDARLGRGLSMRTLAEAADLSHARLSQIEAGAGTSRDTLQRLARALVPTGLDPSESDEAFRRLLNDGLRAAGFASEAEITAELDPDLQMIEEGWDGFSQTGKRAIKSAAELALEMSREGSIGGKRAE